MKAFFDRHQKNKSAPGWSPDEDGFPSNSRIAWAMWGSDAGWSWAKKVVEQMNAADEKNERGLRPYGSTHGMRPRVYVVHGAPCSGKKDYVASHLGENDVVFDYDEVMAAISGRPIYQPNSNLVSYCLDIRTLILKKALKSQDIGKTWVIATRVGDDMKSMLSDVPTQYVHVDKPKGECLQRLEQDEQRQPIAEELRKVIEEYFSSENEEHRRAPLAQPGVERRFLGNFSSAERLDPELLRVEKRSDPETGRPQTYIVGYAARFHRDSLLLGDFVEQIDPGAFEIVTNRRDEDGKPLETRCLFNHDPNYLLGRFPTTMRMVVDDKGLKYECLLPEAHSGIAESIARGDLKGSSFSFVVAEGGERWATENGQSRRIVTKIKAILDCGPVTYPAYSDASVAVAKRSYEGFVGVTKKPVVEKRKKRLESLAKRAEVLRTRIAAEAFLAERRDCGREEDGKFAKGNTCGGASEASGSEKGLAKAYKATGSSLESVDKAAKSLGLDVKVKDADGTIVARSKGATAFQVSKGKEGADVLFYSTGDPSESQLIDESQGGALTKLVESEKDPKKFAAGVEKLSGKLADSYERSARELGAGTVSASLFDEESVAAFKSRGFVVSEEPAGKWAPTVVTKKLSGSGNPNVALAKKAMEDWEAKRKSRRSVSSVSRRDCGRDEGGKFGSGNECQEKGKGGSANIAKAKKALHDYEAKRKGGGFKKDEKFSSPDGKGGARTGVIVGAVVGAVVGGHTLGGIGGLVVGGLTGAALGALAGKRAASINKLQYEGLKKKTGISEDQVKKAAGLIAGNSGKSHSFASDGDTLMIESSDKNETLTFITAKSQFSKSGGTSLHATASFLKEPTNVFRVESAANTIGAANVSVEAWSDADVESLKERGYKMVAATGEGSSSSKGVWEKKLKGKRSVENRDCGRGEGGQFGSGNKCQEDEDGGEESQKSGRLSRGSEKGVAQEAPPLKDESPKYMELSGPVTPTKAKAAQKFIDAARKGQLERGGKDKGKSDDGSGVQTWSKGDSYPWTTKQVGDSEKGGYVQGTHPDGSKTEKYKFPAGSDGAEAYKQAEDEIKKKTIRSLRSFLEARR